MLFTRLFYPIIQKNQWIDQIVKGVIRLSDNKRTRILRVKEFFEENTDADHLASMHQIIEYLENNYEIEAERKSIIYDIDALNEFCKTDIRLVNGKRRYIHKREFSFAEILLLSECVAAAKNITADQSKALIKKLGKQISIYERDYIYWDADWWTFDKAKTTNDHELDNMATIHRAISGEFHIDFTYFQYNMKKEREFKDNGKVYHVFPDALIYENNMFYLLAYEGQELKTFRVDRMDKVTINDHNENEPDEDKRIEYDYDYMSEKAFLKSTFGMLPGNIEKVTMLFTKDMIDNVMDKFGEKTKIEIVDDDHFRIKVDVAVSLQFFGWVFGLGDNVMIEYPLKVAKQMMDILKERHMAYRTGHSWNIYRAKY